MADFPALPLWTDAYLGDTMHLTLEEHGAYLKLLMIAWRSTECSLSDNDKRIAQMLSTSERRWKEKLRPIIAPFWDICEGKWTQGRLLRERKFQEKIRERNTAAANARWLKGKDSVDAGASPTHPPIAPTTIVPDPSLTDAPSPSPKKEGKKESTLSGAKESAPVKPAAPPKEDTNDGKTKPAKRGTRMAEGWGPDAKDTAFAQNRGYDLIQIERLADGLRAHSADKGTTSKDWHARWRTWVIKDTDFHGPPGTRGAGGPVSGQARKGFAAASAEVALEFADRARRAGAGQVDGGGNGAGQGPSDSPHTIDHDPSNAEPDNEGDERAERRD